MARPAGSRGVYDLELRLDKDSSWRKRELTTLHSKILAAEGEWKKTLARTGVLFLYAHWEGFVKNSAESYAAFVREQVAASQLSFADLSQHYISVVLYKRFESTGGIELIRFIDVVSNYFSEDKANAVTIDIAGLVDTKSNLSEEKFFEIAKNLDLRADGMRERVRQIDSKIVANRHSIAHGEGLYIGEADYRYYSEILVAALDDYSTLVKHASREKWYTKAGSDRATAPLFTPMPQLAS